MLNAPSNVNGRPNSDVIVPWANGMDIVRRPREMFIIDFDAHSSEADASAYELPFEHVHHTVRPFRQKNREERHRSYWWRHLRSREEMRTALRGIGRYICTPRVAKHRLFGWLTPGTLPDSATIAIARSDDYAIGILQSHVHELWSLSLGSSLEDRPRYTPTSTFETFPFPWPLDKPSGQLTRLEAAHEESVAEAARLLDQARRRWLNPPELVREESDLLPSLPKRLVPRDDEAARKLARLTLTNLYNSRPTWLDVLHRRLDEAVLAAYGWPTDLGDEEFLRRLLALNQERAAQQKN